MNKDNILNIIKYVKTSGNPYDGKHKSIGYHSISIDGIYYKGQRDCHKRLEYCKKFCDFTNKNVLDIGCNIGGMLFPLANTIKFGCGIDFNFKNINAGNIITHYKKINNLSYYVFDLDKEDFDIIKNFIQDIDIVFLYSVCMWINKWKELINFIGQNSKILFIETNGTSLEQKEQIEHCKLNFNSVVNIYKKSLDDNDQQNRQLYICRNDIINLRENRDNRQ